MDWPEIDINVDRDKAGQVGLTQKDVSNSLLISLASSSQIAPTQWLDWRTGVSYFVAVQTPQYNMDSLSALMRTPIGAPLGNVNTTTPTSLAGAANSGNSTTGAAAQPGFPGLRQSGRGDRRPATAFQPGRRGARRGA